MVFAVFTLYVCFKAIQIFWAHQSDSSAEQTEAKVSSVQQPQTIWATPMSQRSEVHGPLDPVELPVSRDKSDRTPTMMPTTLTLLRNLKTNYRVIPLLSKLDYWGLPINISFPNRHTFNPAILALPYPGEDMNASYVVVARDEYKFPIDEHGYMYQPRAIYGGLLHLPPISDEENRWRLREHPQAQTHSALLLEDLIHSHETYFPKCEPEALDGLGTIQGPEDARVFWSHLGEPLMIYNSVSPKHSELCRHFYIVDLRAVYPAVAAIVGDTINPPPIRFRKSVPITYAGQSGFHKNWAPFTDANGDVYIQSHIVPQTIFKLRTESLPSFDSQPADLISLDPVLRHPQEDENCLTIAFKGFRRRRLHQSTPFLDVVLCRSEDVRSGACNPDDPNNRVYMGLMHAQYHENPMPTLYEPRIVTMNATFPFNFLSISKPLAFGMTPPSLQFF